MEFTRASKELEAIMKDNEEVKDEGEDEDEDEGQLLSSSTSITATTQRFSGFVAGFAFASQSSGGGVVRQNKPLLSDDTTSRTRTAIQTSTTAFHSSSNSPSTKRKRKGKEEGDNVATSRQTPGDSNNKKRKVNDIVHLPPLEDRLDMYLDVIVCGCKQVPRSIIHDVSLYENVVLDILVRWLDSIMAMSTTRSGNAYISLVSQR
ncbi:hypothetical protein FRC18_007213 [Serendipita sp. 400]|nr:hypothetical protein FRC18_007213 [Serendipita sp. 400]